MIKFIKRILTPDATHVSYNVTLEGLLLPYMSIKMGDEIVDALAKQYVKEFGPEILKRIQEKTIESKVIQKVIENLKKELK